MVVVSTGMLAPEVDLIYEGEKQLKLNSYEGKNIVLYFYPKDNTSGCTAEANDFKDHIKDFDDHNTIIIGVSKDSLKSHDSFKKKLSLPFILASDHNGKTCEIYDVWKEKSMYGRKYMGIERSTFLIDTKGIIRKIWRKVSVKDHVSKVLEELKIIT